MQIEERRIVMLLRVIIYANGKKVYDEHCEQVFFTKGKVLELYFTDHTKKFIFGIDFDWFNVSYEA